MFRRTSLFLAVVGCGILPTLAAAQAAPRQTERAANPAVSRPAANPQPTASTDAFLARWLIIDNQNEIEAARLAQQKSKDSDVKQFAEQMIQDHQKLIDQLARFANENAEPRAAANRAGGQAPAGQSRTVEAQQNGNNQVRTEVTQEPARVNGQAAPERRTVARVTDQGQIPGQASHQSDMLALKQELADECRNSIRQELDRKDGKEFDECYIGMQLAAHMMAIDTMKVFERHASNELKQTIANGVKTAEGHLSTAKKIMREETKQEK
ncbi:MAG TPA: DUF4142 domain-containing protein [Pirellulales bacterium]|jgi:predicted outer membrane protein